MNCLEQGRERGPGVSSGETLQVDLSQYWLHLPNWLHLIDCTRPLQWRGTLAKPME